jgi:putative hydrolase of the HAD superfamily
MQQNKWVIFDADNTLWDVETLYDRARDEFCRYVLARLEESEGNRKKYVSLSSIENAQRHRDLHLHASLGYSSGRFARSFEDTLIFFMPTAKPEVTEKVVQIAMNVFDSTPAISEDLESVLTHLGQNFKLAILTAGDESVQERRLADFRLKDRFHAVEIVPKKTQEAFENFCQTHNVDRTNSWVVGDSVRSDILPAREIGLRAIHLKAPNWAAEDAVIPTDVISIDRLSQIIDFAL